VKSTAGDPRDDIRERQGGDAPRHSTAAQPACASIIVASDEIKDGLIGLSTPAAFTGSNATRPVSPGESR